MTVDRPQPHPICPTVRGRKAMVASGNALATLAGARILERGGNAVDAGVAAGLCLAVTQPDMVSFAGVAPMMIHTASRREIITIDGAGVWPRRASVAYFQEHAGSALPTGLLRSIVPAAPAAWLTALARYGTLSFAQVSEDAIGLAADGFPVHRLLAKHLADSADAYRQWPSSAEIFLPANRAPLEGEIFVQLDLANVLQAIADAEQAGSLEGRQEGFQAAHDAFYRGPIARRIADFYAEQGGLLAYDDLAAYRVRVEPPLRTAYKQYEVCECGPWSQGPVLLQTLQILKGIDIAGFGHNDAQYIHFIVEALKLAFADREAYYGDPEFVDVPMDALLSERYASERRMKIRADVAFAGLPEPGLRTEAAIPALEHHADGRMPYDTSYVCVVDESGNAFSATPSDASNDAPVVPGTGFVVSTRGAQSHLAREHPNAVAAGKRPRMTPNPAMVFREGKLYMPFGTPGGDFQCQMMCQVFLNLVEFGMSPQLAVEAPRFATQSAPNSSWPHGARPGVVTLEADVPEDIAEGLRHRQHTIARWQPVNYESGAVCLIAIDPHSGVRTAGVDPRRESFAIGW